MVHAARSARQALRDGTQTAQPSQDALALLQKLGSRHAEAEALTQLSALQHLTGDHQAAAASRTQALALHREVGDRQGQAETLNHLGALQATTRRPADRLARYTEALTIARDHAAPLDEADALAGIGCCHIQARDTAAGCAFLRQALDIYQRIGSPSAQRVQKILNEHATGHPLQSPPDQHAPWPTHTTQHSSCASSSSTLGGPHSRAERRLRARLPLPIGHNL